MRRNSSPMRRRPNNARYDSVTSGAHVLDQHVCFAKYMANDDFSEPPRRAGSKSPIFIYFADFWAWVTPGARGSVSIGFWEARQLSPFLGRGGSSQRALSTPHPPEKRKPALPERKHEWSAIQARGPLLVRTRPQRGGGTPPPSTDPKIVARNKVLCRRRRRRRFCFRHTAGGIFLVPPYVSILKILRILWRIQKWLKSTKKVM